MKNCRRQRLKPVEVQSEPDEALEAAEQMIRESLDMTKSKKIREPEREISEKNAAIEKAGPRLTETTAELEKAETVTEPKEGLKPRFKNYKNRALEDTFENDGAHLKLERGLAGGFCIFTILVMVMIQLYTRSHDPKRAAVYE